MDGYRAAATLLVAPDADQDEVRRAFRARAKALHPDAGPDGSAPAFVELCEAFDLMMASAPAPDIDRATAQATLGSDRFMAEPAIPAAGRVDVVDCGRARTRPTSTRRAVTRPGRAGHRVKANRPVDTERAARAESFDRHLATSLAAMSG